MFSPRFLFVPDIYVGHILRCPTNCSSRNQVHRIANGTRYNSTVPPIHHSYPAFRKYRTDIRNRRIPSCHLLNKTSY